MNTLLARSYQQDLQYIKLKFLVLIQYFIEIWAFAYILAETIPSLVDSNHKVPKYSSSYRCKFIMNWIISFFNM